MVNKKTTKRVTRRTYHIKASLKTGAGFEEWKVKGTSMEYHCDGELYHLCIWDKKVIVFAIDWSRVLSVYSDGSAQVTTTNVKSTNLVAGVRSIRQIKG